MRDALSDERAGVGHGAAILGCALESSQRTNKGLQGKVRTKTALGRIFLFLVPQDVVPFAAPGGI